MIGQVFGDAFDLYRKHLKIVAIPYIMFLILAFIIFLVALIFFLHATGYTQSTQNTLHVYVMLVTLYAIYSLFAGPLLMGTSISMVKQYYADGSVSLMAGFREAKSKLASMVGASLVLTVVSIALFVVAALPLILGYVAKAYSSIEWILIITYILSAIAGAILIIITYQTYPAIIFEDRHAIDAVKRGIAVGRIKALTILAVILVDSLIAVPLAIVSVLASMTSAMLGAVAVFVLFFLVYLPYTLLLPGTFYKTYVKRQSK